jgi:uncharacterized protein YbgA (DUF1722 family)
MGALMTIADVRAFTGQTEKSENDIFDPASDAEIQAAMRFAANEYNELGVQTITVNPDAPPCWNCLLHFTAYFLNQINLEKLNRQTASYETGGARIDFQKNYKEGLLQLMQHHMQEGQRLANEKKLFCNMRKAYGSLDPVHGRGRRFR